MGNSVMKRRASTSRRSIDRPSGERKRVRTQALFTFENGKPIMFGNFIRGSREVNGKNFEGSAIPISDHLLYEATAT